MFWCIRILKTAIWFSEYSFSLQISLSFIQVFIIIHRCLFFFFFPLCVCVCRIIMSYSGSSEEGVTIIYSICRNKREQTTEFVANRKIFLSWVFKYLFFSFQIMEYNLERKPFTFYLISQRIRRHPCKEFTQLMEALTPIKYSVIIINSCENWALYIWIIKIITTFAPKTSTFIRKIIIF